MLAVGVGLDTTYNSGVSFSGSPDAGDLLIVLVLALVIVLGWPSRRPGAAALPSPRR